MANFRAACSGNFINSLLALANSGNDTYRFIFMFPLCDDGSECDWVNYIRKHGYEVVLLNDNQSSEDKTKFLFDIIEKYRIELLHNHFSLLDPIVLWNKELHSRVKILYHDHMDYVAERPVLPQVKKQIKLAKRYREYGIGVISVMKRKHRGYFLAPKRWYIPNGITYNRNVEHSMSREECRRFLGLDNDEKMCLFLGWSIYGKGLDIALKALKEMRTNGHSIILGVVGFGSNPSSKCIMKIIQSIGVDPRQDGVIFLDSTEDMFALHRAADVFLSASRIEAFSYAILEAISQNVPVVASDISGTKWCLEYSKSYKFPNEDYKKCAKAIVEAVKHRDDQSNSSVITDKYNIDTWCDRVLNAYKKMLEE